MRRFYQRDVFLLVVIEYDKQYKAEEMLLKLRRMQKEYLASPSAT